MKRVLIIAYHFPPAGTGGVGRAHSWARYLGNHGWQPTVLASTPPPNWPRDESLLQSIPPDVNVVRVPAADPRPSSLRGIEHRELSFLWSGAARRAGRELAKSASFDIILATAPPPVSHAVARKLGAEFNLPWIADFRDPWAVHEPTGLRRRHRNQLLQHAAAITAVHDRLREHLADTSGRPVETIFNGYEPDDIPADVERVPKRVAYLGTMSEFNDLDTFFRALAEWNGEFVHVGAARHYDVEQHARSCGVKHVRSTGYLPRAEALREAASASILLLSLKPHLTMPVSAKVFDYIGLGGHVLCVGDHGAEAEFVRSLENFGAVVPAHDTPAIRNALDSLSDSPERLSEVLRARFARPKLAAEMAAVLDRVVAGRTP